MDNSIYKKCTECGQTKHISEFSKSYPNRCKTCVAEHTRQMRAAEKLKAKVKATGEVIDVESRLKADIFKFGWQKVESKSIKYE